MSGKLNLALAVIAMQHGNKDDCLSYMAKATDEFGDDLNTFVSEIIKPPPRAARNDGSTPQAENTLSPSLASSDDFVSLSNRISRVMAIASSLDDGDELDFEPADESFDDLELDTGIDGVDEDEDEDDEEDDEEALASTAGPIRYKR